MGTRAARSVRNDGKALDPALLAEQLRSLSSQVPTMYLVLICNSAFLEYVTMHGPWTLGSCLITLCLTAVGTLRITFWHLGQRSPSPSPARLLRRLRGTIATAFLVAAFLAAWSISLLIEPGSEARHYVPFFTALSTITCATCLIGVPRAAYAVIGAGTVPIAIALLISGDATLLASGLNLLAITALMVALVRRQHGQMRHMVAAHVATNDEKLRAHELAYSDQLTGLPNRRAFIDALRNLERSGQDKAVAVAMLDLDGFKAINDTLGHATGDALLAAVSQRLSRAIRPGDMLARLGGDEFALLMCSVDDLASAKDRLVPLAAAFDQPFAVDQRKLVVRTSIGVAHRQASGVAIVDLMHHSDLALYEAKAIPSLRICAFEEGMAERVRRRILIEQAAGADDGLPGLSVHYQPIVETASLRLTGFEALARWRHAELGEIMPAEFIGIAERHGTIDRFTQTLLHQALAEAASWPDDLRLSFNLSAAELVSPTICESILSICRANAYPTHRLAIEVTESALLNDISAACRMIEELRAAGLYVLLDDFGAGFASIGYLRHIRFDEIKLDGSLIRSIVDSSGARDLLVGVVHLCRSIGMPVTAEMVETEEQLELLRVLGVNKVQGYLFGRPAGTPCLDAGAGAQARRINP